jgi:hypothetical protein
MVVLEVETGHVTGMWRAKANGGIQEETSFAS